MRAAHLVSAVALVVCATSTVYAQSLGDIARKEEERKKTIKTSGKVYTDADLRKYRGLDPVVDATVPQSVLPAAAGTAPAAGTEGEAAAATTAGEAAQAGQTDQAAAQAAPAAEAERNQAWWRQQFAERRMKVETATATLRAMVTQYDLLGMAMTEDPAERVRLDQEREKVKAQVDRLTNEVDVLSRALAALEDEARRANVPPGWIR